MRPFGFVVCFSFLLSIFLSSYSLAVPATIGAKKDAEIILLVRKGVPERYDTVTSQNGANKWPIVGTFTWGGTIYGGCIVLKSLKVKNI